MRQRYAANLSVFAGILCLVMIGCGGSGGSSGDQDPNSNQSPRALSITVFQAYDETGTNVRTEPLPIHVAGTNVFVWNVDCDAAYTVDLYYSADATLSPATDLHVTGGVCNDGISNCTQDDEIGCSLNANGDVLCDGMTAAVSVPDTMRFVFLHAAAVVDATNADTASLLGAAPVNPNLGNPTLAILIASPAGANVPSLNPVPVFENTRFQWAGAGILGRPFAEYTATLYYSGDSVVDAADTPFYTTTMDVPFASVDCTVSVDTKVTCGTNAAVDIPLVRTFVILEISNPADPAAPNATQAIGLLTP